MKIAIFALTLICATSLNAGSILGGELRFTRTTQDQDTDIGGFHMPFLYGKDKHSAFAVFGIDTGGWCTKLGGLSGRIECGFDTEPFTTRGAISGGKFITGATVDMVQGSLITFKRFHLDGDGLSAIVPFKYSIGWLLKDNDGDILNIISGFGRGLATLQFDSAHNLLSSTMDVNAASTPEPISLVLTGTGLTAIALWRRRKRTAADPAK